MSYAIHQLQSAPKLDSLTEIVVWASVAFIVPSTATRSIAASACAREVSVFSVTILTICGLVNLID
jgi:hypothetical protein